MVMLAESERDYLTSRYNVYEDMVVGQGAMPAPSVGYQGCSTVESVRPQMTPQNFLTMSEGWRKLGRTEPNSSLEAAGEQPIMPAMAQGPLEEPPGPVSPAWWPARKAATVSSCEKRHNQLRSPPMGGHQLTVQINLLPSPHLFLPLPREALLLYGEMTCPRGRVQPIQARHIQAASCKDAGSVCCMSDGIHPSAAPLQSTPLLQPAGRRRDMTREAAHKVI